MEREKETWGRRRGAKEDGEGQRQMEWKREGWGNGETLGARMRKRKTGTVRTITGIVKSINVASNRRFPDPEADPLCLSL